MEENDKKSGSMKKILMGMIIGGAVGSVVGATMSNKELRDKMREKMANTSNALKEILHHKEEEIKEETEKESSFWHFLNRLFVKK